MEYTIEKLLETALGETGYLEKASADLLDDKTANAGSGNYTKYARDLHKAGYYSGNKQGVAWCSMFVDWCHYMASGKDKKLAQKNSCQSGIYGASCTCSMNYYKAEGRFFSAAPQPGDQIYFGSGSTATHTGLVSRVEADRVYTVEGNTSAKSGVVDNGGGVFEKSYEIHDSRILGYGRPRLERTPDFSLPLFVLRKGAAGGQVKALQQLLQANGCDCGSWGADGSFGAATEGAVRAYQKSKNLEADGIAGSQTWGALLGKA